MDQLFHNLKIPNVATLPMTNENGYAGMGNRVLLSSSQAILVADVVCDIRSFLSVAAVNRAGALDTLEECWRDILAYFEKKKGGRLSLVLASVSRKLAGIPLAKGLREVPVVSLLGEIFVRHDEFSRKNVAGYLEDRGVAVRIAPVTEYLAYSNHIINQGLAEKEQTLADQMRLRLMAGVQEWWERRIKTILARSGCYRFEMIGVEKTIGSASHLMDENFRGECILTVGLSMREILNDSCGVISIGPFGCMPSRVAEAILKKEMNAEGKLRMKIPFRNQALLREVPEFPFLAIETDGSPFPQLVEANLEAFVVQAKRVHEKMKARAGEGKPAKRFAVALGQ
jgi:predicted nucleotide-binding protein (sugar kinase/HSP70/actin superfamily)